MSDYTNDRLDGWTASCGCSDKGRCAVHSVRSSCCGRGAFVRGSDEGTMYYVCERCDRPCDVEAHRLTLRARLLSKWREWFGS